MSDGSKIDNACCENCFYYYNGKCTLQLAEKESDKDFCLHWTPG